MATYFTSQLTCRDAIEHFAQGRQTVDEFFNRFEALARQAGLTAETEKIRLVERHVRCSIIDSIYATGNLPANYAAWKTRILTIGRLLEQRHEQLELEKKNTVFPSRHLPTTPAHHSRPSPSSHAPQTRPASKKTSSSTVFAGAGVPMDLDSLKTTNRCFDCGEVGHFRNACPKPDKRKINFRAFVMEELSLEEREELLVMLAGPSAADTDMLDTDSDFL
jgi:hypothetical protein